MIVEKICWVNWQNNIHEKIRKIKKWPRGILNVSLIINSYFIFAHVKSDVIITSYDYKINQQAKIEDSQKEKFIISNSNTNC